MSRTDAELSRPGPTGPAGSRWARARVRVGAHPALTAAVAVVVVVALGMSALLTSQRDPGDVGFGEPPLAQDGREPATGEDGSEAAVGDGAPEPAAGPPDEPPADEPPADDAPRADDAPPAEPGAEPARIAVRDERLYLVDADGQVLRTLRDAHDGSQEYTLRNVTLRPGSTTRDLAVAFVEGYMTGNLRVLVVRGGGEPQVTLLTHVDYEAHDQQPMALPAGVWSPDGGLLAWLEPDPVNRGVLRAVHWSSTGMAGDATPAGGIPVDPEGLMAADETRGLELAAWQSEPVEHLRARAYRPYEGGAERHYTIGVQRQDGQLHTQPLARV